MTLFLDCTRVFTGKPATLSQNPKRTRVYRAPHHARPPHRHMCSDKGAPATRRCPARAPIVRIRRKMAYLFPILRDEIHIQYIFQYLESQDAILTYLQRVAPAGEQNFEFSGARRSKSYILGKIARCRAWWPLKRPKVAHFALDN